MTTNGRNHDEIKKKFEQFSDNQKIADKHQKLKKDFQEEILDIYDQFISKVDRESRPLMELYEMRYIDAMYLHEFNLLYSVKYNCKYAALNQASSGLAKCKRKQLMDLAATTVYGVMLSHEVTSNILPLLWRRSTVDLSKLEFLINKLQFSTDETLNVWLFHYRLEMEVNEEFKNELPGVFVIDQRRVKEMEYLLRSYEFKGAFSVNECSFCCPSDSSLCDKIPPSKEEALAIESMQQCLLQNYRLTFYEALGRLVSRVKNG